MMSTPLVIDIVDDTLVEGTEDFNVKITSALVTNVSLTIVVDNATVSIIDSMDGKLTLSRLT